MGGTEESQFKKLQFKKESRFKKNCFLVNKLFDLRKILFRYVKQIGHFLTILEQFKKKIF